LIFTEENKSKVKTLDEEAQKTFPELPESLKIIKEKVSLLQILLNN